MIAQGNIGALTYLAIAGSLASIISIVINVCQGIVNRNLKRTLQAVLLSDEKSFQKIIIEADNALKAHAASREGGLKSIKASAERAKEYLAQIRIKTIPN